MIQKTPLITYKEFQDTLKISADSVNAILHQHLGVKKLFLVGCLIFFQMSKKMKEL